jgi:hypothetical protein
MHSKKLERALVRSQTTKSAINIWIDENRGMDALWGGWMKASYHPAAALIVAAPCALPSMHLVARSHVVMTATTSMTKILVL